MKKALRYCGLLLVLLLTACANETPYQVQDYVFGTLVDVSIQGLPKRDAEQLAAGVMQEFRQLHQQLHAWQPDSELSGLNQAIAHQQAKSVSPLLGQMLRDASDYSAQSKGLFNPAIGQLIALWGFQRDEFSSVQVDDAQRLALLKADAQMSQLQIIDSAQGQPVVTSRNPAVKLDLGGYAKGYALDVAANYLKAHGVKNALVNIGGNIIALGQRGKRPWQVGIQHPRQPGSLAVLTLADGWAIGTSGDYQRYFERDGKRYCHIIDPRTGAPAQGTQSVTVLIPPSEHAGVLSDVASKPIFIASANQQQRLDAARRMHIENYLVVDAQGQVLVSKPMRQRLRWIKQPEHIQQVEP